MISNIEDIENVPLPDDDEPEVNVPLPDDYKPEMPVDGALKEPDLENEFPLNLKEPPFLEKLRPYQREVFEEILGQDSILFLPTGAGKTVVAAALAAWHLQENPEKRVVFIVNRVPLVEQQSLRLQEFLGPNSVETVRGDKKTASHWSDFIEKKYSKAVVIIDTIFYKWCQESPRALKNDICLVLIDEMHNATGGCYQKIIELIHEKCPRNAQGELKLPHIVGLTASPVQSFCKHDALRKLLDLTQCRIVTAKKEKQSLQEQVPVPVTITFEYRLTHPELAFQTYVRFLISGIHKIPSVSNNPLLKKLLASPLGSIEYKNKCEQIQGYALDRPNGKRDYFARIVASFLLQASCSLAVMEEESLAQAFDTITDKSIFEYMMESEEKSAIDLLIPVLRNLQAFKKAFQGRCTETLFNKSSRVQFLFHILDSATQTVKQTNTEFRGIVFCDRRASVYKILKEFGNLPRLRDICSPKAFVGKGRVTVPGGEDARMTDAQQRKAMEEFRKGETRLLVATSVAEEGLDIELCNVVIRYDSCLTLRSFIQSRGRARKKDAIFIVLEHEKRPLKVSEVALKAVALQEHLVATLKPEESNTKKRRPWEAAPDLWIRRYQQMYNVEIVPKQTDQRGGGLQGSWLYELILKGDAPGFEESRGQPRVFSGFGSLKNARKEAQVELCETLDNLGLLVESGKIQPVNETPIRFLSCGICICQSGCITFQDIKSKYAPSAEELKYYTKTLWEGHSPYEILLKETRRMRLPAPKAESTGKGPTDQISITVFRREPQGPYSSHVALGMGDGALHNAAIKALNYLGVFFLSKVPENIPALVQKMHEVGFK